MKKSIALLSIAVLVTVVYSCKKSTTKDLSTTAYLDLPATPYSYQTFFGDTTVNYKATLGRVLFYDAHLSVNNAISCASCHKQAFSFADNKALSTGYEGITTRNSPGIGSLMNRSSLFWDGREDRMENLSLRPLTNHVEMGIDDLDALSAKLASLPYYGKLFKDAYGDEQVSAERISTAIADFMEAITPTNTRFDQYEDGNISAMSALEINGMNLFTTKYQCGNCHNDFGYTGGAFVDIGLDVSYTDMGRGGITGVQSDMGKFRIPSLRNVALTAPYMHDGRYKTLDEVIDHYSQSIYNSPNLDTLLQDGSGNARAMAISDQEKSALVAFLGAMTDYSMITDPKFSNPFKVK